MFSNELREAIEDRLRKMSKSYYFLIVEDMHHLCYVEIVVMYHNVHCDISLTYHKSTDQLKCHYCGYHEVPPNKCPN